MSRNIVFEGWLTKSPPTKRIWRTKWRRRWFTLRQSGELPGQYFLDYYADRNCRRLKGSINLDLCEQVDAGLHMERSGTGSLDPKLRGSVFTIQTHSRTYLLEAECEAEMGKWVDAICRVCCLRATDEPDIELDTFQNRHTATYQNNLSAISAMNEHYECADSTGPYIPISECITGVRAQYDRRAFTFDPKNIVRSTRVPFNRVIENKPHQIYYSIQPQIRLNNTDFSENESNLSDEECESLDVIRSNIRDWPVGKSFTKSAKSQKRNGAAEDGPPVPPRPPKTFAMSRETMSKEIFQGPKIQEPIDTHESTWTRVARRMSHDALPSPNRPRFVSSTQRHTDDEEEYPSGLVSMQYSNLPSLPPAVDRALKPRHSSHSIGHKGLSGLHIHDMKTDVLQYLDLDLPTHTSETVFSKAPDATRKGLNTTNGKSLSVEDTDSAYRTVDFLKTEAFNITRQGAEASRNIQIHL